MPLFSHLCRPVFLATPQNSQMCIYLVHKTLTAIPYHRQSAVDTLFQHLVAVHYVSFGVMRDMSLFLCPGPKYVGCNKRLFELLLPNKMGGKCIKLSKKTECQMLSKLQVPEHSWDNALQKHSLIKH